ncbi:CinY protein [Actinomadura harenae]|nr:CinY protein [Actinomadura harenae]
MYKSTALTAAIAGAVACAALAGAAPSAYSFGTLDGKLGQRAEHERITRAALACPSGKASDNYCFESDSLSELAGAKGKGGGIGAPDLGTEALVQEAHCDNADYLADSGYPQSRADATSHLLGCVRHAHDRMTKAVAEAARLLDGKGQVDSKQVSLTFRCFFTDTQGRAKCDAIEQFGRGLHAVQDFYSHSNWADTAGSGAIGATNPPGLGHSDVSPLFRLFAEPRPTSTDVPENLTTGCFDKEAAISGEKLGCMGGKRIRHHVVNKDLGLIDPATGHTSDPTTDRGKVADNFARAVTLAITDTRGQWRDLVNALEQHYPDGRGTRMACAITHDNPTKDCK